MQIYNTYLITQILFRIILNKKDVTEKKKRKKRCIFTLK